VSNYSFRQFFDLQHEVTVRINATNVCNIHCTHCDNDAHLPFSKNGDLIFRRKPLVADAADIEAFCHLMDGVGQEDPHLLTGGEITALPVATLVDYIGVLHRHGRKVGMRTNGYNVRGIPPDKLNLLDRIHMNSHGVNEEAINASRAYLDEHYRGRIISEATMLHRDLKSVVRHREGTIEQALACNHLLTTITFLPPVVLPCCNTWALMNSLNSDEMMTALAEAGWTVRNPGLKETLKNWRETLPHEFLQSFCADSCYMTRSTKIDMYPIEAHPRDRALKRISIVRQV
jgi:molybdenum cofactor biosynthesis enzyme MoaA